MVSGYLQQSEIAKNTAHRSKAKITEKAAQAGLTLRQVVVMTE
jgi:hypothetical protein